MPWKGEKNAYRIWLSEIILQQTRVEQGMKYYLAFTEKFPDVHALANADEESIFKTWEGLGYYTRCRNLILSARYISKKLKGAFPASFEAILSLKGVGPYTAAAIASFAYNLPHPVVDGNVFRVFSRILGIETPIDSTAGKKEFSQVAEEFLDRENPAEYNQAIMDFGATVCRPKSPLCSECAFNEKCFAFNKNMTGELPVKGKKIVMRERWLNFIVLHHKNRVAIRQRNDTDIWKGLYEFPLIETNRAESGKELMNEAFKISMIGKGDKMLYEGAVVRQVLTHQYINGRFLHVSVNRPVISNDCIWVETDRLSAYAFPKLIREYLATASSFEV
jgi:A/G-specific adenine glycosylase